MENNADSIDVATKQRCDFKSIINGAKILSKNLVNKYCTWKELLNVFGTPIAIVLGTALLLMLFQVIYLIGIAKNYLLGTYDFSKIPWWIFEDQNKKHDYAMGLAFTDGICIVAITAAVVCSVVYGKRLICHLCELGQENQKSPV